MGLFGFTVWAGPGHVQFQNSVLKYGVNLVAASIRRQDDSARENPGRALGPQTFSAVTQSLALSSEI